MNKIIGTAITIGLTLVCSIAMAGNGGGSGDGALRTFTAEKPLPKNPDYNK